MMPPVVSDVNWIVEKKPLLGDRRSGRVLGNLHVLQITAVRAVKLERFAARF
jgi:hypothetical protein